MFPRGVFFTNIKENFFTYRFFNHHLNCLFIAFKYKKIYSGEINASVKIYYLQSEWQERMCGDDKCHLPTTRELIMKFL